MTSSPRLVSLGALALAACSTAAAAPAASTPDPVLTALAERRLAALEHLTSYAARAEFPVDDQGYPVGVFRDPRGVRCPMAEVIATAGRGDLVDHVARTKNDLKLVTVHDGPLMDWMRGSGLTHEEIVMVQGAMDWGPTMRRRELEQPMFQIAGAPPVDPRAAAREEVKARLAADLAILRAQTGASVSTAAARLTPAERWKLVRAASEFRN